MNIFVPDFIARKIYWYNKKSFLRNGNVIIDTYDGSGQLVHPDLTCYKGELWMVATPYPYGMEEYENPCTYFGSDLNSLHAESFPLVRQKRHLRGFHLSDPCISNDGSVLYCFYRESEPTNNRKERNTIKFLRFDKDIKKWGEETTVYSSDDDAILSPAFLFDKEGSCHMLYVSRIGDEYSLVHNTLSECFIVQNKTSITVLGIPEGFNLWHIGVVYRDTRDKFCIEDSKLIGLFLLKSKDKKFKLYFAVSNGLDLPWKLHKEINVSCIKQEYVNFFYKSCFIPFSKSILISYVDSQNRYKLLEITDLDID